jgi:hypothetical protein
VRWAEIQTFLTHLNSLGSSRVFNSKSSAEYPLVLAASHAKLTSLRAVFLPYHESLNDGTRFEKQFVTGKDAEKLHDLDVANG